MVPGVAYVVFVHARPPSRHDTTIGIFCQTATNQSLWRGPLRQFCVVRDLYNGPAVSALNK